MTPDLIEDFIAFLYTTQSESQTCPQCGAELTLDDAGGLHCPVCDE